MKKTLLTLLLASAALPALAGGFGSTLFADPYAQVAQLTSQERRALRERWEEASPEERSQLRREFQERLRQGADQQPRQGVKERTSERRDGAGHDSRFGRLEDFRPPTPNNLGDNFGTGFEHRRFEGGGNPGSPQGGLPGGGFSQNGRRP